MERNAVFVLISKFQTVCKLVLDLLFPKIMNVYTLISLLQIACGDTKSRLFEKMINKLNETVYRYFS